MYEEFQEDVEFVFVYIREAHAMDEWPLGTAVQIPQHRTLEDRMNAARLFLSQAPKFPFKMLVDGIDDQFNQHFRAWPERYYLFDNSCQLLACPESENEFGFNRRSLAVTLGSMLGRKMPDLSPEDEPVHSEILLNREGR